MSEEQNFGLILIILQDIIAFNKLEIGKNKQLLTCICCMLLCLR